MGRKGTKVCKGCGKKKAKGHWIYKLDSDHPNGKRRISVPYCDKCFATLPTYEGAYP